MSYAARLGRQVRFENRAFWRNPAAAMFTFAFPLLFLVIFTSVFDDTAGAPGGREVDISTYYLPAILSFAVLTSCYTNVAMTVTFAREQGILKRVAGTPLPRLVYLLGKVVHAVAIMVLLVAIVVAFGVIVYDVEVPTDTLLPFLVSLVLGAATFCALGLAVTSIIPNADAAPGIVNAIALPILFISGTFIPTDQAPDWLQNLAEVFPLRHFIEALFAGYGLNRDAPDGWLPGDLAVVAAWGVAGVLLATRFFRWERRR
ncbi:MAG: ABC transporter permease [Acidimicrobiales bacterium]